MLNSLLNKKNLHRSKCQTPHWLRPEFPALKRLFGNTSVLLSPLLFVALCHSLGLLFALFSKCIRLKIKSQTARTEMSQFRVGGVRFFSCDGAGRDFRSPFIFAVNQFMTVLMSCPRLPRAREWSTRLS